MPPDKPQHFVNKLKKAPKTVEGGKKAWAKFHRETKIYYENHKSKVSKLVNEIKGPAAKKAKTLRSQYLGEMLNSVGHVIDGNEATKTEMNVFKAILRSKSEKLRVKLTREHKEQKIRDTISELQGVKDMFQTTGLKINLKTQVIAYLQLPKSKRLPIETIKVMMKSLFDMETKLDTRQFANIIKDNKNLVYTIFNHCCLGNKSSALKEMKKVKSEINFRIELNQISKQTGITKLSEQDLNGMMSALMKSGIPRTKVASFLIKNINKLKKLDPESFQQILKAAGSSELSRLLLTAVVGISSGTSEKVKAGIKLTLKIEGQILAEKTKAIDKIKQNDIYIQANVTKLKAYRKANPDVTIDTITLGLEKNIAEGITSTHFQKKILLRAQVTHIIANTYLSKKGINPAKSEVAANINKLLGTKDAAKLAGLCFKSLQISPPPQINTLRAAEFKEKASTIEADFKKSYHSSFKSQIQFRKNSGNWTWANSIQQFYKTGKLDRAAKSAFNEQFDAKSARQIKLVDEYAPLVQSAHGVEFVSLQDSYKTIKGVPKEKLGEVAARLTGHMSLLKNVHSSTVHLIGNLEGLLLTTLSSERKTELKKYILKYKKIAKDLAIKINEVNKFVGKKEDKKLLVGHENAVSPIHAPLVLKDFSNEQMKLNMIGKGLAAAAGPVSHINYNIKWMHKHNPRMVYNEFTKGMKVMDNLVVKLENARAVTLKTHAKLVVALKATDAMNIPSGLKNQRKRILKQVLKNLEHSLNSVDSPLMQGNIQKVKNGRTSLEAARDKYAMDGLKKGVVIACVMAAAIGAAVVGGMAAGALGAKAFGSVAAGSVGAGWIPVGAGVASFATGSLSMMGVAAGSVIGAKLTQQFFTSTNIMDFRKSTKDKYGREKKESLWKTEDLLEEYSNAFVMSLIAVGAAKGLMKGLKHLSTANYYKLRFPGLTRFSQSALGKMDIIGKIANPSAWFQSAREGAKKGFLRMAGKQTIEETGEEIVESAAEKIHPLAGFLASVANAADGCSVSLAMHGVKAPNIGISYNSGVATYTTKTPKEFVQNLNNEFQGQQNFNHETTINKDGSVTLVMYVKVKNKTTGKTRMAKYRMIDIFPSKSSADVSPDTELARMKGLTQVDKEGEIYTIKNSSDVTPVLKQLLDSGFIVIKKENGNYVASKGDKEFKIKVETAPSETTGREGGLKASGKVETPIDKVDQVKLKKLGSRLEAIGLSDLAYTMAEPNIDRIPMRLDGGGKEIKTYKQRLKEVNRLVELDSKIKLETDFLRDSGLEAIAKELEDYKNTSKYKKLEQRFEVAQKLGQGVEVLFNNGIPFKPENAEKIIGLLNGTSKEGQLLQKLLSDQVLLKSFADKEIDKILIQAFGKINPKVRAKFLEIRMQRLMKPEDRAVYEANRANMTPELMQALVVGGRDFESGGRTVRIYKGKPLGAGGMAEVNNVWYVEKSSTKLQEGVVKIPHEHTTEYFNYESNAAKNLSNVFQNDKSKAADHVIKPLFASAEIIIYKKITDVKGKATDLHGAMETMSTKDWLSQFTGGVEGLIYLHNNGISHNDFKPANIVVGKNGGVVIDIGSFISKADIKNKRILTFKSSDHNGQKVPAIVDGGIALPVTPQLHDPTLIAHSIDKKQPLNLGDKFAVGTSLMMMLTRKGFVSVKDISTHSFELKTGASDGATKLYNLAKQLMNCKNHPYEYKGNNKKNPKDAGFVSLESVIVQIKQIASTLPSKDLTSTVVVDDTPSGPTVPAKGQSPTPSGPTVPAKGSAKKNTWQR